MRTDFRESFAYAAWIVFSDFDTPTSYRIYMRFLYPGPYGAQSGPNLFSNKHLGADAAQVLKWRNLQGLTADQRVDARWLYNAKEAPNGGPVQPIPISTVVDFARIDRK